MLYLGSSRILIEAFIVAVEIESFRNGMRRFTGGVCLITTIDGEGRRSGLTATAVCSVTMEPPTILICVNRKSSSHDILREAGIFAVNVLSAADHGLAKRFSGAETGEARFDEGAWTIMATGAPVLDSALVGFDCTLANAVDVGSHGVFFGEVQAVHVGAGDVLPLLYAQGSYGSFGLLQTETDAIVASVA
jgi:flavin reductase (DIM6/NTAB) family NADH-FMN oxidoreductase RutF